MTKPDRTTKLLNLLHCPSALPGERASARLRLREMGFTCRCQLCAPPLSKKPIERNDYLDRQAARIAQGQARAQYRAARPKSVAWAEKIAQDKLRALRTIEKFSSFEEDGARIPVSVILEVYPSEHADRSILAEELNRWYRFSANEDVVRVEGYF